MHVRGNPLLVHPLNATHPQASKESATASRPNGLDQCDAGTFKFNQPTPQAGMLYAVESTGVSHETPPVFVAGKVLNTRRYASGLTWDEAPAWAVPGKPTSPPHSPASSYRKIQIQKDHSKPASPTISPSSSSRKIQIPKDNSLDGSKPPQSPLSSYRQVQASKDLSINTSPPPKFQPQTRMSVGSVTMEGRVVAQSFASARTEQLCTSSQSIASRWPEQPPRQVTTIFSSPPSPSQRERHILRKVGSDVSLPAGQPAETKESGSPQLKLSKSYEATAFIHSPSALKDNLASLPTSFSEGTSTVAETTKEEEDEGHCLDRAPSDLSPSFAACASAVLAVRREGNSQDAVSLVRKPLDEIVDAILSGTLVSEDTSPKSQPTPGRSQMKDCSQQRVEESRPASVGTQSASLCAGYYASRSAPGLIIPTWPDLRGAPAKDMVEPVYASRARSPHTRSRDSQCLAPTSGRSTTLRSASPAFRRRESASPASGGCGVFAIKPLRPRDAEDKKSESAPSWSLHGISCLSPAKALRPGRAKDSRETPNRQRIPLRAPSPISREVVEVVRSSSKNQALDSCKKDALTSGQARDVTLKRDSRDSVLRAIAAYFQPIDSELGQASSSTRPHPSNLDFYAIGKLLGKGAFGKVNVGVHKLTEELAALKLCERRRIAEVGVKKSLMQEVGIIKRLAGHPNIIQIFEVIESPAHVVLVMEFAPGGDLLRFVRQRRRLSENQTQELFKQLMDGISHIHTLGVVHRDIKLENLLLDSFGCVKIADFGVAKIVTPTQLLDDHCGTPSYIAPEILLDKHYEGQPVDVWSAGVVLYAMLCGRVPFKGENLADLKRCILRGRFRIPPFMSALAGSLINSMLTLEPRTRCTVVAVLLHAWLEGTKNRADYLYGKLLRARLPEEGRPEGCLVVPQNDERSQVLLDKVADFGFPKVFVEESLLQGNFNHATATFHLLLQQSIRKQASLVSSSQGSGFLSQPLEEGVEVPEDVEEDDAEEIAHDP